MSSDEARRLVADALAYVGEVCGEVERLRDVSSVHALIADPAVRARDALERAYRLLALSRGLPDI